MSPGASCVCHPLSCLCVLWDFLSCTCPWSTGILWWVSSLRCLFCREKRSNSFRLLSQGRLSSLMTIFVFFLWTLLFVCVFPEPWARCSGASWQRLSKVGWGHLHLCQACPCRCSEDPVCLCCHSSALMTLPACPSGPPDPFQQGCFQATQFQAFLSSSVILDRVMWW